MVLLPLSPGTKLQGDLVLPDGIQRRTYCIIAKPRFRAETSVSEEPVQMEEELFAVSWWVCSVVPLENCS
ncbi:hypothetical protein ATANTOWER_031213 [Ataeniobius toweri]|uniref:Uncharacterized protein n=1 Tax=Ataeniobius toweri TaxID=208326 RepID=A0ABU7CLG9_9TELE|nr:hypothetical protein [Ataeniobius toweri]